MNVTSARPRVRAIRALGADILLVTEPRVTEGLKSSLAWDLQCPAGDDEGHALPQYVPVWSRGVAQRSASVWDGTPGGAAVFARTPLPCQETARDSADAGRLFFIYGNILGR